MFIFSPKHFLGLLIYGMDVIHNMHSPIPCMLIDKIARWAQKMGPKNMWKYIAAACSYTTKKLYCRKSTYIYYVLHNGPNKMHFKEILLFVVKGQIKKFFKQNVPQEDLSEWRKSSTHRIIIIICSMHSNFLMHNFDPFLVHCAYLLIYKNHNRGLLVVK